MTARSTSARRRGSASRGRRPRRSAAAPVERVATVERLGRRGDGLVPAGDGLPAAHVAGALPGETVRIAQAGERGSLLAVLAASPDRVAPPCPHFGACGGCQLQHLAPEAYRAFKLGLVTEALAARGLDAPAPAFVAVPAAGRRRAVMRARRDRSGATVLGFSERRGHALVAIETCLVLVPGLAAALPALRGLAAAALGPGEAAALTAIETAEGIDVALATERGRGEADPAAVADAAAAFGSGAIPPLLRVVRDGDLVFQAEQPAIAIDGATVPLPPGAFLQASAAAEREMARHVTAGVAGARRIADLYAGLGTFAFPLSRIAPVHAVDADPALARALAAARPAAGHRPITTETRDLAAFPLSAAELDAFDAVVFDPPRAGAEALSVEIARSRVDRVVAVSCNPATLARDLALLAAKGFKITHLAAVDQFVHAAHIEVVATLRRTET